MTDDSDQTSELEVAVSRDDVAMAPNDNADPASLVDAFLPEDIRLRYEVHSYRSAAVVLAQSHPVEFNELMEALRHFSLSRNMIQAAGGNESQVPKRFSSLLRPQGWYETIVQGDLIVRRSWSEPVPAAGKGKPRSVRKHAEFRREKFLDGHKIDYVKGKVAFDLEWNSKDQTFDRDLYAFSAFATCGVVDVGVLVTRSASLNPVFRELGVASKYGASTTWMGKLLYRLNAGRNAACPVLAIGITPACIEDQPS